MSSSVTVFLKLWPSEPRRRDRTRGIIDVVSDQSTLAVSRVPSPDGTVASRDWAEIITDGITHLSSSMQASMSVVSSNREAHSHGI